VLKFKNPKKKLWFRVSKIQRKRVKMQFRFRYENAERKTKEVVDYSGGGWWWEGGGGFERREKEIVKEWEEEDGYGGDGRMVVCSGGFDRREKSQREGGWKNERRKTSKKKWGLVCGIVLWNCIPMSLAWKIGKRFGLHTQFHSLRNLVLDSFPQEG